MKTKALQILQSLWRILSEVPGWADPTRAMRLRRALPILLPLAGLLLLAAWNLAVRDPLERSTRRDHAHLVGLERDIGALREIVTDAQAVESATRSREMVLRLHPDAASIQAQMKALKDLADEFGWTGTFQANDTSLDAPAEGSQFVFQPARGRLSPQATNQNPLPSLLNLLEVIPASPKRIELTRLAIRADEQGKYTVDLNLRLAVRPTDEKAP